MCLWFGRCIQKLVLSVKKELLELECLQSKLDPALFYWLQNGQLQGLFLIHVDDFLWAGTNEFRNCVIDVISDKFQCGKKQDTCFKYIGLNISQNGDRVFLDQHEYTAELDQIRNSVCDVSGRKIERK